VETFGTGTVDEDAIARVLGDVFDFRPRKIIETLDLRRPIYSPTAAYGHFGREPGEGEAVTGGTFELFPWERTDRVDALRSALDL
jgi:S-adenosylmethionine synthetase